MAILSKTFLPIGLVITGVAIIVPPRYNPPPAFYVAVGVGTYVLLLAGAALTAVVNIRNNR